jgi:SPT2 chromatin protein.
MDKPKSISKGKYEEYDPLNPSRINSKKSSNEYDPLETVVRRDKVNSNKPVSKPSENIKRINDKPPLKKLEPELVKKPKLSEMDKKKTLKSVFQGPLKSKQQYDSYDEEEEDDYDENDSFINDDDQEEEAQRILAQMFGGFRQKMAQRKHLDYDTDDMEARFEDIEKEEYFSRKIAQREDEEQARLLKMEKLKKKHKH